MGVPSFGAMLMHSSTKTLAFLALCLSLVSAPLWAYTLTVQIEPPGTAGMVIDRADSYLTDAEFAPESKAYFGGWDGWGIDQTAPASLSFKTLSALPKTLSITWYEGKIDQFWGGRMALPRQDIMRLLRQYPDEGFNRLVVSLATKGRLTLWLASNQHEVQLGQEWQASETTKDWASFVPSLPRLRQTATRADFTAAEQKRHINPYNDELFALIAAKQPVADYHYMISRDDGLNYCGHSNAEGETRRVNSGTATMKLVLYSGPCPLLEDEAHLRMRPTLMPDLIQGVRRLLPY